ncbi:MULTISPECIES: hypothetical protein [Bacillaceae]|uniref:hypothetical protein n=1 Tax=Bacillaceae TaxID=186817 RepID=UPI0029647C00|nr:hypothetical protein [Bacillus infantis]MDW2876135.1 hypothetical protein [Bacillus infantis]
MAFVFEEVGKKGESFHYGLERQYYFDPDTKKELEDILEKKKAKDARWKNRDAI